MLEIGGHTRRAMRPHLLISPVGFTHDRRRVCYCISFHTECPWARHVRHTFNSNTWKAEAGGFSLDQSIEWDMAWKTQNNFLIIIPRIQLGIFASSTVYHWKIKCSFPRPIEGQVVMPFTRLDSPLLELKDFKINLSLSLYFCSSRNCCIFLYCALI